MSVLNRNEDKHIINNFKSNSKTHSTVGDKKFIPLYAKTYQHFTFEQSKFKQYFVVINKKLRKTQLLP